MWLCYTWHNGPRTSPTSPFIHLWLLFYILYCRWERHILPCLFFFRHCSIKSFTLWIWFKLLCCAVLFWAWRRTMRNRMCVRAHPRVHVKKKVKSANRNIVCLCVCGWFCNWMQRTASVFTWASHLHGFDWQQSYAKQAQVLFLMKAEQMHKPCVFH